MSDKKVKKVKRKVRCVCNAQKKILFIGLNKYYYM